MFIKDIRALRRWRSLGDGQGRLEQSRWNGFHL